jgi:hypothetical protein
VSEARQYLAAIPAEDRKDTAAIERLEAYLERNKECERNNFPM